eukprot:m.186433 g.186433  ORF g.186433 m.186433 type:complete len:66 (+) comp18136_c0_seq1:179-376(+)
MRNDLVNDVSCPSSGGSNVSWFLPRSSLVNDAGQRRELSERRQLIVAEVQLGLRRELSSGGSDVS